MADKIKTVMVLGVTLFFSSMTMANCNSSIDSKLQGRGNLGPHLISSLSKADFKVTILSRSSSEAPSVFANVPVVQSDYTFTSLVDAFHGQDAVICAVPRVQIEDPRKIIDAAVAAKVKRFLPSEFGTDTSAENLGDVAEFFKANLDVVAYLKQKELEGLSWTALCTGPWIDWVSNVTNY